MSGKVMGQVFKAEIRPGSLRDVLLSYANHADQYGADSRPKLATVALESGWSVSTVKRQRTGLENMGILVKTATGTNVGGRQYSNVYSVNLSKVPVKQGFTIDGPLVGGQQSKTGGAGVHHRWTGQQSTTVPSATTLTSFERPKERQHVEGEAEDQRRTEERQGVAAPWLALGMTWQDWAKRDEDNDTAVGDLVGDMVERMEANQA